MYSDLHHDWWISLVEGLLERVHFFLDAEFSFWELWETVEAPVSEPESSMSSINKAFDNFTKSDSEMPAPLWKCALKPFFEEVKTDLGLSRFGLRSDNPFLIDKGDLEWRLRLPPPCMIQALNSSASSPNRDTRVSRDSFRFLTRTFEGRLPTRKNWRMISKRSASASRW